MCPTHRPCAAASPVLVVDRHLAVSQAAGAFVLGLEDEFLQVRAAAIGNALPPSLLLGAPIIEIALFALESMSRLAKDSREFALEALPSLVDMFNDEIAEIRIKTIDSIRAMGDVVAFDENQLQIVLACLEEANVDARKATYALLSTARLGSAAGVLTTVNALCVTALNKFPRDQPLIFGCLNNLGLNHATLICTTSCRSVTWLRLSKLTLCFSSRERREADRSTSDVRCQGAESRKPSLRRPSDCRFERGHSQPCAL